MPFPEGFLWGTGASSTQTEGAAPWSDWQRWEQLGRAPSSGTGNDFSTRYAEDFQLLADHSLNHHRLSLEWARLEPEEGKHDPDAIEHYTAVLQAARDAGINMWVCLHHFTLPGWFSDDAGGFNNERARGYHWARHVDWVGETFGDLVYGWKPINEPVFYALLGYRLGLMPPGRATAEDFAHALESIHLASFDAARLLRSGGRPVATIEGLMPVYPATRTRDPNEREEAEKMVSKFRDPMWSGLRAMRDGLLAVPGRAPIEVPDATTCFDLIGFSYYAAQAAYADGTLGPYPTDARVGPMGYAPWPEGLGVVLRSVAEELPGRPILIDECGLGTPREGGRVHDEHDDDRVTYLEQCLGQVELALHDGLDIKGFFHWTAVDNYEWLHGYDVMFGLFDRDRTPKESAAARVSLRDKRIDQPVTETTATMKEQAGRRAATYVEDGMRVGLGTGSTVHWTIVELGERKPSITCVATSDRTQDLATSLGLKVVAPDDVGALDIAIDGADEIDPAFNLTKGAGGAHTREKIVARMSARFIVVVDEHKLVPQLGPSGTPVELLAFAPQTAIGWIEHLGAPRVTVRPEPSDSGNLLADAHFGLIETPDQMAAQLDQIPGLVGHGIFPATMVERVVVGGPDGVRELVR